MTLKDLGGYFRSNDVSRWRKAVALVAVAYTVLPVDAVPDVIPILGWLDDVGVLTLAATWLWRDVARHKRLTA
jgi:uncharacterized membrane protein YkvA (DUF1232 family)